MVERVISKFWAPAVPLCTALIPDPAASKKPAARSSSLGVVDLISSLSEKPLPSHLSTTTRLDCPSKGQHKPTLEEAKTASHLEVAFAEEGFTRTAWSLYHTPHRFHGRIAHRKRGSSGKSPLYDATD